MKMKIKINYLEKNKIDVESLKEYNKESIKNNKLILKKNKDLEVKSIMCLLKKSISFL